MTVTCPVFRLPNREITVRNRAITVRGRKTAIIGMAGIDLDAAKLLPDSLPSSLDFGQFLSAHLPPGFDPGKTDLTNGGQLPDIGKLLPENVSSVLDLAKRIPGNPFQLNDSASISLPPYLALLPSGNRWLFYVFQLFNLAVTLSSTAQVLASTFLVFSLGQVSWSSLGFLVNGGVSVLLGLLGPITRHKSTVLVIYNSAMTMMASVQTGFAVAGAIWADYPKTLDSGVEDLFRYGMLVPGALQFATSVFSWCYKCSFVSSLKLRAVLPNIPGLPTIPEIPGLAGLQASLGLPVSLGQIAGMVGGQTTEGIPGLSGLASIAGLAGLPSVPGLSGLPSIPGLSGLQSIPGLSGLAVPGLPELPIPGLAEKSAASVQPDPALILSDPGLSDLPSIPELAGLPKLPAVPSLPGVPSISAVASCEPLLPNFY